MNKPYTIRQFEGELQERYVIKKITDKMQIFTLIYAYEISKGGLTTFEDLIKNLTEGEILDRHFYAAYIIESTKPEFFKYEVFRPNDAWLYPFLIVGSMDGVNVSGTFLYGRIEREKYGLSKGNCPQKY